MVCTMRQKLEPRSTRSVRKSLLRRLKARFTNKKPYRTKVFAAVISVPAALIYRIVLGGNGK